MNRVYLGWANPRKAWWFDNLLIIILQDDRGACVLKGKEASAFSKALGEVIHHLTGVRDSTRIAKLIDELPDHPHDHPIFNSVFDEYFEPDPELALEMME